MRFISLFAGVGGFDLALERLGHECVYANDIDKYCKITYDKNFCPDGNTDTRGQKNTPANDEEGQGLEPKTRQVISSENGQYGKHSNGSTGKRGIALDTRSITNVPTSEIPDHDLLCGGFPCQSFSIAGKRGGFLDTRGTLFFEIARILKDKKPRYFILENVKGLLSHDGGTTFKTIIATLTELGYGVEWQVLNSKNFGVPQNRERVFIVGHLGGEPRPKVFPIGENSNEVSAGIKRIAHMKGFRRYNQTYDSSGVVEALDTSQGGGHQPCIVVDEGATNRKGKAWFENETPTINTEGRLYVGNEKLQTTKEVREAKRMGKIRRLTPLECERLQGFPDNWTQGVSDTQRYKQMGNAVTVNVVFEVAKRLSVT